MRGMRDVRVKVFASRDVSGQDEVGEHSTPNNQERVSQLQNHFDPITYEAGFSGGGRWSTLILPVDEIRDDRCQQQRNADTTRHEPEPSLPVQTAVAL